MLKQQAHPQFGPRKPRLLHLHRPTRAPSTAQPQSGAFRPQLRPHQSFPMRASPAQLHPCFRRRQAQRTQRRCDTGVTGIQSPQAGRELRDWATWMKVIKHSLMKAPAAAQTQGSRSVASPAWEASGRSTGGSEKGAGRHALCGSSAAPLCRYSQHAARLQRHALVQVHVSMQGRLSHAWTLLGCKDTTDAGWLGGTMPVPWISSACLCTVHPHIIHSWTDLFEERMSCRAGVLGTGSCSSVFWVHSLSCKREPTLFGPPAVQLSVFGTSVFAARHMAACNWPGFASEGLLWCHDLTKAAAVIHWGQVLLMMLTLGHFSEEPSVAEGASSTAGECRAKHSLVLHGSAQPCFQER